MRETHLQQPHSDENDDDRVSITIPWVTLHCPINLHIMEEPSTLPCGHTFEKAAIKQWFNAKTNHSNNQQAKCPCPECRQPFDKNQIQHNLFLQNIIVDALKSHPEKIEALDNWQNTFWQAVRNNENRLVELFIQYKREAVLALKDDTDNTVLHLAAKQGKTSLVKLLLDNGADIFACNKKNKTPIQVASYNHQWDCVRCFAENKKDDDDKTAYGYALLIAVEHERWDLVPTLLNANASLNYSFAGVKQEAYSALFFTFHFAIWHNNQAIAKLLLAHNQNINQYSTQSKGYTPLFIAAKYPEVTIDTFRWLLKQPHLDGNIPYDSETPLMVAVTTNQPEKVQALLCLPNIDIIVKNNRGYTAMQLTERLAERQDAQRAMIIEFLKPHVQLKLAFQYIQADYWKEAYSTLKTIKPLLFELNGILTNIPSTWIPAIRHFADQQFCTVQQATTILWFSFFNAMPPTANDAAVVHFLLDQALPTVISMPVNEDNQTALHLAAAQEKKASLIERLIYWGADITAQDKQYRCPIEIACKNTHWDYVSYFIDSKTDENDAAHYDSALVLAAADQRWKTVELLVTRGRAKIICDMSSVNIENSAHLNYSALHYAIFHNHIPIAEFLLAHGADINTHYAGSEPPFWVAAQNSNVTIDTFNWLLAHPGLRDDLGRYEKTPLMAMIENNQLEKLQSWLTLKGMELVHQYESTQIEEKLTAMGKNDNEAVIFINSYKQLFYLITINPKTPSSLDVVKKWLLNTGKISAENAEQMGIILKEKYPEKSKDVDLWCDWFSGKSFLDIDTMNKNLFAFTLFAQQCKENTYAFEIIRAIVFNQFKKYFNTYQNKDADQKEILLHAMQSSPLFASYFKPSGVLSGIKIAVFTAADVFPNYSKEFESMEKEIRAKLASSPHPLTNS